LDQVVFLNSRENLVLNAIDIKNHLNYLTPKNKKYRKLHKKMIKIILDMSTYKIEEKRLGTDKLNLIRSGNWNLAYKKGPFRRDLIKLHEKARRDLIKIYESI
jgi:hypothetical protein